MIGAVPCGSPSRQKIDRAPPLLMYVLSPFAPFGLDAMLFGNIGLAAAFALGSAVTVQVIARYKGIALDEAALVPRFPSLALKVAQVAVNGVAFAGFSLLQQGAWQGIAAVMYVAALLGATEMIRRRALQQMRFEPHARDVFARLGCVAPIARRVFPVGVWLPASARTRYSAAIASLMPQRVRLAPYRVIYGVCFAFVSSFDVPVHHCHIQYAVLASMALALAAFVALLRPLRGLGANVLVSASSVTISCTLWCTVAVLRGHNAAPAASAFSVVTSVLALLAIAYTLAAMYLERRVEERPLVKDQSALELSLIDETEMEPIPPKRYIADVTLEQMFLQDDDEAVALAQRQQKQRGFSPAQRRHEWTNDSRRLGVVTDAPRGLPPSGEAHPGRSPRFLRVLRELEAMEAAAAAYAPPPQPPLQLFRDVCDVDIMAPFERHQKKMALRRLEAAERVRVSASNSDREKV